jgi:hypothetical protein
LDDEPFSSTYVLVPAAAVDDEGVDDFLTRTLLSLYLHSFVKHVHVYSITTVTTNNGGAAGIYYGSSPSRVVVSTCWWWWY